MNKPSKLFHDSKNRYWTDRAGLSHRKSGPSMERQDGSKEWYWHGDFRYHQTGEIGYEVSFTFPRMEALRFPGYKGDKS